MKFHTVSRGPGKPLLLVHGTGESWASWELVIDRLTKGGREVIAVDLPGRGQTPPLSGPVSVGNLADAVTEFLKEGNLLGIDAVGAYHDHVCLSRQAARAESKFPDAELYWFPNCGHFPQWDRPELAAV